MLGRGSGNNVGNRNKDGKGNCNGGLAASLNPNRNEGNRPVINRILSPLNQIRTEGNCHLENNNVGTGHQIEDTQMQDDNINSNGNPFENESEGFFSPNNQDVRGPLGKRKRMNKFTGRINKALQTTEAANLVRDEEIARDGRIANQRRDNQAVGNHATSRMKKMSDREKYKSYIVDMKLKCQKLKLKVYITDDIDRVIGENAHHFVNECGRVVRTKAHLNVKNWKDAFAIAGDKMWKEIEGKFEIKEGGSFIKLQAFAIDTMQRLYRLWKAQLHYYCKSKACGQTDEERLNNPPPDLPQEQWKHCVERFQSDRFKVIFDLVT